MDEKRLAALRASYGYRRVLGVYDDALPAEEPARWPVGTVASWPGELTVPGETTLPAWAISSVSVAPTHMGRGIARAMMEGELRTAAALKLPMAMLTVSESTLYERYGFAPAALASDYRIENRRGHWVGPDPVRKRAVHHDPGVPGRGGTEVRDLAAAEPRPDGDVGRSLGPDRRPRRHRGRRAQAPARGPLPRRGRRDPRACGLPSQREPRGLHQEHSPGASPADRDA